MGPPDRRGRNKGMGGKRGSAPSPVQIPGHIRFDAHVSAGQQAQGIKACVLTPEPLEEALFHGGRMVESSCMPVQVIHINVGPLPAGSGLPPEPQHSGPGKMPAPAKDSSFKRHIISFCGVLDLIFQILQ